MTWNRVPDAVAPMGVTESMTVPVGVPSPQPLGPSVAVTLETVASVLGSVKVASTMVPVFWPSTAWKLLTDPVTARSVTVAVPVRVTVEPSTSLTTMLVAYEPGFA